jgi:hypothetical protein
MAQFASPLMPPPLTREDSRVISVAFGGQMVPQPLDYGVDDSARRLADSLRSSATTRPEFVEQRVEAPPGVVTEALLLKFLNYTCSYKKHKGSTYGQVMQHDYQYFLWMLTKAMNPATKTWGVLSCLLTEEERRGALEHAKTRKPYAKQSRPLY